MRLQFSIKSALLLTAVLSLFAFAVMKYRSPSYNIRIYNGSAFKIRDIGLKVYNSVSPVDSLTEKNIEMLMPGQSAMFHHDVDNAILDFGYSFEGEDKTYYNIDLSGQLGYEMNVDEIGHRAGSASR